MRKRNLIRFVLMLFVFVCTAVVPLFVFAQTPAPVQQTWWQALISGLLPVVSVFAIGIITIIAWRLSEKWGLKLDREMIEKFATQGMGWAEEKAQQRLNAGHKKTPGAEKAKMALDMAIMLGKQFKLKEKALKGLDTVIEAKLGAQRKEAKIAIKAKRIEL